MKQLRVTQTVDVPKGVKVAVKARVVTVTGPRGTLHKNFKHANFDMSMSSGGRRINVDMWFGNRKERACARTITSHLKNMFTGVLNGYEYKMRLVYAHFPINVAIEEDKEVQIRNFLGEKVVRCVPLLPGVSAVRTSTKDEIAISGNDIEAVSQTAANIQQSTRVRNKDIRKFLDGIYVSEKKVMDGDE